MHRGALRNTQDIHAFSKKSKIISLYAFSISSYVMQNICICSLIAVNNESENFIYILNF